MGISNQKLKIRLVQNSYYNIVAWEHDTAYRKLSKDMISKPLKYKITLVAFKGYPMSPQSMNKE